MGIHAQDYDYTNELALQSDDMLYGVSMESDAYTLFKHLAATSSVKTIYDDTFALINGGENVLQATLIHESLGLPINKTIFGLTHDKMRLDRYVEHLGGYPVIIKSVGGSHGVGVMKFDSPSSLYAGVDFLLGSGQQCIMRHFIEHDTHARLIVLGNEVIDSIAYHKPKRDFRTNVGSKPNVEVQKFGDDIEAIAVRATHALGSSFGGVDIMFDSEGRPHIAEVNVPCFFPRAQLVSGVDIAGQIISYLKQKS